MSEPRLSSATRELLRAARSDVPGAAARAKIWSGVSAAAGGAAGAAGAAASAAAGSTPAVTGSVASGGGIAAGKMLALGTLLGGTVTVGLAVTLLRVGSVPAHVPPAVQGPTVVAAAASAPPAAPAAPAVTVAQVSDVPVTEVAPGQPHPSTPTPALPLATPPSHAPAAPPRSPAPTVDDTLTHEAMLVAEARGALVRGEPEAALRAVRAARALPSHQLAPEEMAVEAQALRALGRDEDARDVDSTLRRQFPESALAR